MSHGCNGASYGRLLYCSVALFLVLRGLGEKTETALTSLPFPLLSPRPSRSSLAPAVKLSPALLCKHRHLDLCFDKRGYVLIYLPLCPLSFTVLPLFFNMHRSSCKSQMITVSPKPSNLVCLLFFCSLSLLTLLLFSRITLLIALVAFSFSHYLLLLALFLSVAFINGVVTLTGGAVAGSVAGKCMTCSGTCVLR